MPTNPPNPGIVFLACCPCPAPGSRPVPPASEPSGTPSDPPEAADADVEPEAEYVDPARLELVSGIVRV